LLSVSLAMSRSPASGLTSQTLTLGARPAPAAASILFPRMPGQPRSGYCALARATRLQLILCLFSVNWTSAPWA